MSLKWPEPGQLDIGLYQVSSIPWVTSSAVAGKETLQYDFPKVTRFVTVKNISADATTRLAVGFSANGIAPGTNGVASSATTRAAYFTLKKDEELTLPIRVKTLYLSATVGEDPGRAIPFNLVCGLTEISHNQFPILTGSNGGSQVGVG